MLSGVLAALGSSAAWAAGSILFRRVGDDVAPVALNLAKGLLSVVLLGIALLAVGFEPLDWHTLGVLGASGLLGIALGDTLFFAALVRLGPRTMIIIVGMLGPVLSILLASIYLQERLNVAGSIGVALTLAGMLLATWEPAQGPERADAVGIAFAVLSCLCMSASIILAKVGVADVGALQATFVRMVFSVVGLGAWWIVCGTPPWFSPFQNPLVLRRTIVAGVVIVFGGFFLSLYALKHVEVAVATALSSTEPIFVIPLTAWMMRQAVHPREVIGVAIGVAGVALIFLR